MNDIPTPVPPGSNAAADRLVRALMLDAFQAAIAAVGGRECVINAVARESVFFRSRQWRVVAVGKAASAMANGAREALAERIGQGLLITKYDHLEGAVATDPNWTCLESAHPVPDENSLIAGKALIDFVSAAADDRHANLLVLISGGASSLVEHLSADFTLEDLRSLSQWLLGAGVPITQMNRLRPLLSGIKAGRLARFLGRQQVRAMLISDVPGDDPAMIGSGLLLPGGAYPSLASAVDELPETLRSRCDRALVASAKPADSAVAVEVVASLAVAKQAACRRIEQLLAQAVSSSASREDEIPDKTTVYADLVAALPSQVVIAVSDDFIDGDAVLVGRSIGESLTKAQAGVYVYGGETTCRLPKQPGRGGRNQALALSAACAIEGQADLWVMSLGTDGTDGPGVDAGAIVDGQTVARGKKQGLDPLDHLERADSGHFLEQTGDLVQTGPTGTNVMDLIIAVKLPAATA